MAKVKSEQSMKDRVIVAVLQDEKASARDKETAFNRLYSRHERQLHIFFLKKVKDGETAEDLKMITFEKVYENIAAYDETYAFSTWMYKIAVNSLIDSSRKANFEQLSIEALASSAGDDESGTVEFQIESDALDPEAEMERNERIESVKDAIDSLENDLLRELMEHRFLSDLSFDQIAEKMGIENNSTLRVNVLRGKEILKEKLKGVNPYA